MIKKIDTGPWEKIELLEKVNEIIDHLNIHHADGNFHLNTAPVTKGLEAPHQCIQCGAEITFSRLYGDPRFCTDQCQDEWNKKSVKIGPIGPGLYSLEKEEK